MKCPQCNSEMREQARFCDQCGAPLSFALNGTCESSAKDTLADDFSKASFSNSEEESPDASIGTSADEGIKETSSDDISDKRFSASDAPPDFSKSVNPDSSETEIPKAALSSGSAFAPSDDTFQGATDALSYDTSRESKPEDAETSVPSSDTDPRALSNSDVEDFVSSDQGIPPASSLDGFLAAEGDVADPLPSEEGDAADAGESPDEDAGESCEAAEPPDPDPLTPHDTQKLSPDITLNLSEFSGDQQEQVVGSGYQLPESMWHTGDTMKMPKIDGAADTGRDFRAPDPEVLRRRRRKRNIAMFFVVAVLCVIAAVVYATYEMELWGGKRVPEIVGLAKEEATALLEEGGFAVRPQEIPSDDDEGIVLLSDPTQGSRVEEGSLVNISISIARTIPDVIGMNQDEALAALDERGYENITVVTEKSDNPEGSVLAISQDVGTKVTSNFPVTLTVAEPFIVPDVVGQDEEDARAILEEAGYDSSIEYVFDSAEAGTVVSTEPEAGSQFNSGEIVSVYVAKSLSNTLVQATREILYSGNIVIVNDKTYAITSVTSVSYVGSNTTSYTFVGNQVVSVFGQSIAYTTGETVSGTLVWSDDGTLRYGNPSFKY